MAAAPPHPVCSRPIPLALCMRVPGQRPPTAQVLLPVAPYIRAATPTTPSVASDLSSWVGPLGREGGAIPFRDLAETKFAH